MRPSQNLPPPSQNIPPFSTTICDPPRIYPFLPEYTPFSMSTICDPPTIYPSLSEYTPFSTTICDPPRIYSSLPEYTPIFNNYKIMRPSQNLPLPPRIFFQFWEQVVDSLTITKASRKGAYSVTEGYVLGISHIVVER